MFGPCQTCARYQIGAREVDGYVLCGWDEIEIDIARPREVDGRPRTLQRPTLGQVWIRVDAAIIVGCIRHLALERAVRTIAVTSAVDRDAARARDAKYRQRVVGEVEAECPICCSPMTAKNSKGQARRVCDRPACRAAYMRSLRGSPGRVQARPDVAVGGSVAGALGE